MEKQNSLSSPVKGTIAGAAPAARSVQEQLKNLRAEDFMSPNQVMCYGGGAAFQGIAPSMVTHGINVVGVIDANKQGTVAVGGRKLPYLSITEAIEAYGNKVIVIVTIADENIFQQVTKNLVGYGFSQDKIFDLNVWTWLTVPAEKSYCKSLTGLLQFYVPAIAQCQKSSTEAPFFCEWFMKGRPLQQSIDSFFAKHLHYIEQSKKGRVPLYCQGCDCLSKEHETNRAPITQIFFSDHTFCNSDCIYCEYACSVPRLEANTTVQDRYAAVLDTLEQLPLNMLDSQAVIQLEGGEITVNPYKGKLYNVLRHLLDWSPELEIIVFSNCFIYDQEIADLLAKSKRSILQCDLDAGTPETYIKVKGFNRFDTVRENLKKYSHYGTLNLKYIILPDWNDSQADYEGTVSLLKELGVQRLSLSPDLNTSKGDSREQIRKLLYATARFMILLEQNGIEVVFPYALWKQNDIAIAKRLRCEIQSYIESEEKK